jgi:succinate-semialdehyde dehydrogenase / glutarate-semialdehyde dehydrogenase
MSAQLQARTGAAFSGEVVEVANPRSGAVDYRFAAPSRAELAAEAKRLRAAQRLWRDAPLAHRVEVMRRWRDALVAAEGEILAALATDTGRYLIARSEYQSVPGTIERWCRTVTELAVERADTPLVPTTSNAAISYRAQYVPYGLVGVISPWNFPFTLAFIDAIPALLAGCAVLVKPSEVTPRFAEPVRRTIEAIPELAAVFAVHPGAREVGEALVELADVICFTGSVRTGRMVAENAARHFSPAFLELGGNDPMIVTASADLELATDVALRSTCLATGQACQSIERVYVDRRIHDAFVARLVEKASRVEPNWPDMHAGTIGPFIFGKQADIVAAQIADAVAKGARVLCGGRIEDHGGKWLRPTVLTGVDHTMQLMTEETFGPVIPVMPFDSIDQAVELANEGVYGLSAAVIAGSLAEAEAIGRRIDAGGISLNDGSLTAFVHEAEKHSFKLSGMGGSRMGPAGYLRFFRKKALIHQGGAPMTIDMIAESHARPR